MRGNVLKHLGVELDTAQAPEPPAAPAEPNDERQPDPNKPPIAGWTPRQLDQGWGAVLEGAQVADLPASDQLRGTPIVVTDPPRRRLDHDPHRRRQPKRHRDRGHQYRPAAPVRPHGISTAAGRVSLPAITAL